MSQMAKPSMFAALATTAPQPTAMAPFESSTEQGITYLGFVHPKSPNYNDVVAELGAIPEGTPYLRYSGKFIRLDEPKFHYYTGARAWVKRDSGGKPISARLSAPEGADKKVYKDTVEAVVLVHVNGTVVPAVTSLRGPKADAGVSAEKALKESQTPEWIKKGKDFAASAQLPVPYARFTVTGRLYSDTIKYGDNAGAKFTGLRAKIAPTSPGEADTLLQASQGPEFKKLLTSAMETLDTRIKQLKSLAK